jgi:hypothetical protein
MRRAAKSVRPIEIATQRFLLRPIDPVRFARRTFDWTSDRQAFADLTWRTDGWTLWRWWRHLRKFARKNRMCHGIWPKDGTGPIGLHIVGYEPSTRNVTVGVLVADRSWW